MASTSNTSNQGVCRTRSSVSLCSSRGNRATQRNITMKYDSGLMFAWRDEIFAGPNARYAKKSLEMDEEELRDG
ncbi:hypothetical protein GcM3_073012 [Golovinomyces cichoracearum]|uniref:Uncharacterized protein n=1 Tax=Golovinomyces cichoracearum TaxID=62708 RepID=A0A420IRT4_9PEZI|nr:hypothetical protein GcM3_073012 [Golovinomyces cichoracearum]